MTPEPLSFHSSLPLLTIWDLILTLQSTCLSYLLLPIIIMSLSSTRHHFKCNNISIISEIWVRPCYLFFLVEIRLCVLQVPLHAFVDMQVATVGQQALCRAGPCLPLSQVLAEEVWLDLMYSNISDDPNIITCTIPFCFNFRYIENSIMEYKTLMDLVGFLWNVGILILQWDLAISFIF
jgi:hypothetical protein